MCYFICIAFIFILFSILSLYPVRGLTEHSTNNRGPSCGESWGEARLGPGSGGVSTVGRKCPILDHLLGDRRSWREKPNRVRKAPETFPLALQRAYNRSVGIPLVWDSRTTFVDFPLA